MTAEPANIHASLVAVGGQGVLLRGPARSGKSALALALCQQARAQGIAACLVADDRVDLRLADGRLHGSAPASLAGLLEISGVGIVAVPFQANAPIELLCDLREDPERMPKTANVELCGVLLPRIELPCRAASLAAAIVLTMLDPRTQWTVQC